MSLSPWTLIDSHKHNWPQALTNSAYTWATKVKHSSPSESPSAVKPVSHDLSTKHIAMDGAANESGRQSKCLTSATYFASPIRTLAESIKDPGHYCISTHDIIEAYHVLSTRIRSQIHNIFSTKEPSPCITIFEEWSSHIAECLSRDIRRALPNPFESQHQPLSYMSQSYYSDSSLDDEDLEIVSNNITLCHYALRFVSDIFTFPPLYSTFSHIQLCSLLRDVLSLCTTTTPPIFNMQKSCAMVLWTLKVQQLPTSVLLSEEAAIVASLRASLSAEVGGIIGKIDSFMAIHSILEQHPTFIHQFMELLPIILDHLNSSALEIRIQAAFALTGFTIAKLSPTVASSFPREHIAEIVQTYLDVQTSRRKSLASGNRLPSILKAALAGDPFWKGRGPSFTISIVSTLLVLLDHHFFSSSRSLKLVFSVLAECAVHKQRSVSTLQPEIWRFVTWAFSRLPTVVTGEESGDVLASLQDTRDRAYLVIRQDLKHGLGVALISVLLRAHSTLDSRREEADVAKAIETLMDLVNNKHASCKEDGAMLLGRLMSGIGAPSPPRMIDIDADKVAFCRELIDGSLFARQTVVRPTEVALEDIPPLTEAEVLHHWEDLSKAWGAVMQRFLLESDADLPSNHLQMWQALLLVQGQLTQDHQYLTASSSFGSRVASIINGFSMPLDGAPAQTRYLTAIMKLWSVMKNVFTTTWLSSPAEIILAGLLKKQFLLSDDQVRDLWSQLCADLISVGIPTLLHVLHVRSDSQEATEVTRQLWMVLAKDRLLAAAEQDWVDLLHLLPMPFGAWDMSQPEFEIWERILTRALNIGVKLSQSQYTVISRLLKLFGDRKFDSLKQHPKILYCLLSRSSPASCSQINIKLLSLIDDTLCSSYGLTVEKKTYALDTLRLIGGLVSKASESEIVKFLATLQNSLCRWIADEDSVLNEDEHKELVTTLYAGSLEKVAQVEPSLRILTTLAKFIQSVFVRIRGDGPLIFQKFWRSTYHGRPDIPKKEYPIPIQACLKAWSDVCEDSLADDISLNSGSQSLVTFTISDSQPSPVKDLTAMDPFFSDMDLEVSYGAMDDEVADGSSSQGTATPVPRHMPSSPAVSERGDADQHLSDPLRTLQEYKSHYDNIDGIRPSVIASKRPAEFEEEPHTPKRRRTERQAGFVPRSGEERAYVKHSRIHESVSEPVTRTSSLSKLHPQSASQLPQLRKPGGRDETPSWLGSDLRRLRNAQDDCDDASCPPVVRHAPMVSSDDYDTWEQCVSAEDLQQVRSELQQGSDFQVPDNEDILDPEDEMDQVFGSPNDDVLSPSLGEYPIRSRIRQRSQTAPELSGASESHPIPHAQPLRRNQTTPLEHKKASSAQLDALQRAYAIITDTGTSQIDVQDIMHARRLANQINQVLDEQMCSKFGASKHDA